MVYHIDTVLHSQRAGVRDGSSSIAVSERWRLNGGCISSDLINDGLSSNDHRTRKNQVLSR